MGICDSSNSIISGSYAARLLCGFDEDKQIDANPPLAFSTTDTVQEQPNAQQGQGFSAAKFVPGSEEALIKAVQAGLSKEVVNRTALSGPGRALERQMLAVGEAVLEDVAAGAEKYVVNTATRAGLQRLLPEVGEGLAQGALKRAALGGVVAGASMAAAASSLVAAAPFVLGECNTEGSTQACPPEPEHTPEPLKHYGPEPSRIIHLPHLDIAERKVPDPKEAALQEALKRLASVPMVPREGPPVDDQSEEPNFYEVIKKFVGGQFGIAIDSRRLKEGLTPSVYEDIKKFVSGRDAIANDPFRTKASLLPNVYEFLKKFVSVQLGNTTVTRGENDASAPKAQRSGSNAGADGLSDVPVSANSNDDKAEEPAISRIKPVVNPQTNRVDVPRLIQEIKSLPKGSEVLLQGGRHNATELHFTPDDVTQILLAVQSIDGQLLVQAAYLNVHESLSAPPSATAAANENAPLVQPGPSVELYSSIHPLDNFPKTGGGTNMIAAKAVKAKATGGVELVIGVPKDEKDELTFKFRSMQIAEGRVVARGPRRDGYMTPQETGRFVDAGLKLILGKKLTPALRENIAAIPASGGTNALSISAKLIGRFWSKHVLTTKEFYPPYIGILKEAGVTLHADLPFWDAKANTAKVPQLVDAINKSPRGSVIFLQDGPHNPTGYLYTAEEAQEIMRAIRKIGGVAWIDRAYQGLGRGLKEDAPLIAAAVDEGVTVVDSDSYSKKAAMFEKRAALLSAICRDPTQAREVQAAMEEIMANTEFHPSLNPFDVLVEVMESNILNPLWSRELQGRQRVGARTRTELANGVTQRSGIDHSYFAQGAGPFTVVPGTQEDLNQLEGKGRVFALSINPNSDNPLIRLVLSSVTPQNMPQVVEGLSDLAQRRAQRDAAH